MKRNKFIYWIYVNSTKEQKLDRQVIGLKKHVDDRYIFTDKQSGIDMDRPQYQLLRKVAQQGDTI